MIKNTFYMILGILLVLIQCNLFALDIKSIVRVDEEKVFLSDIIETNDSSLREKASNIQVSYSPKPGEESTVNGDYIKLKLKQIDHNDLDNIEFPDKILIVREYQVLMLDTLKNILHSKIIESYNDPSYIIKIDLKERGNLKLPLGDLDIEINDYRITNSKLGKYSVSMNILIDNKYYGKSSASVEIGKMQEIFVLVEAVKRGELFSENLVEKKDEIVYKEFQLNKDEIYLENLEGEIFKRNMRIGTKIEMNDFEKRKIFKRNSTVNIFMKHNGIKIKAIGKAMEDGYEGEEVRVLNEKTKKVINGTVQEDGTVIIEIF